MRVKANLLDDGVANTLASVGEQQPYEQLG